MRTTGSVAPSDGQLSDDESGADVGPYVLNLCQVREHLRIPQPRAAHLVHYAFFVSRSLDPTREQGWLQMGYFATRAEAQKWLDVLQRVYPEASIHPVAVTFMEAAWSPAGAHGRG